MKKLSRLWRALYLTVKELQNIPVDVLSYQQVSINKMDYELYWKSIGKTEWFPPRIPLIAEQIEMGATVLDLGCGNGTLIAYLAETRQAEVSGIDISSHALQLAKSKGLNNLQQADLSDPNFKIQQTYDYIVVTEVLEHIPNPENLMRMLHGHFHKAIFVSIPNIGFYKHRLRLLLGRFPQQWGKHPGEHLRFWTVIDFQWWAKWLGYEVCEVIPTNGFPYLYRVYPNLFAEQVIFVLKLTKKSGGSTSN